MSASSPPTATLRALRFGEPALHERAKHLTPKAFRRVAEPSEERKADHAGVTQWFARWCEEKRISVRDLAAILDVTIAVAQKKRSGESPLAFVDVKRFPKHHRRELAFAFLVWCDSSDSVPHE